MRRKGWCCSVDVLIEVAELLIVGGSYMYWGCTIDSHRACMCKRYTINVQYTILYLYCNLIPSNPSQTFSGHKTNLWHDQIWHGKEYPFLIGKRYPIQFIHTLYIYMYFAKSYIFQSHHLEPPLKWPFGTWGEKVKLPIFMASQMDHCQKKHTVNFRERPAGDHFCVAAPTWVALEYCQVDLKKAKMDRHKSSGIRDPPRFGSHWVSKK